MKEEVYSDMRIAMMDNMPAVTVQDTANEEVSAEVEAPASVEDEEPVNYVIDYSKYLGVLEIPKIGLKRGFYNTDSYYNKLNYNVTMVEGSTLPDVPGGNLILMGHSGNSYISFFAYLYRLGVGDMVYVTYAGRQYEYQIVNIYEVEKNGLVTIHRNADHTTLTMITCTRNNDFSQTIYISELVG